VIVPVHFHRFPLLHVGSSTDEHFTLDKELRETNTHVPDPHATIFLQNLPARRSASFSSLRIAPA